MKHANLSSTQIGDYAQVNWLDSKMVFVSNSQDVQAIKNDLGYQAKMPNGYTFHLKDIDAFFVEITDGDYGEIWGMSGIIPYNTREVIRVR